MTTGATGQLGLALPVQGELSGTWGDTVNNGITQYTNIAIAGTLTLTGDGAVTLANTTGDASASNITSTLAGAGTVTAQFAIVKVSGTTTTKVVTGPSYSKTYVVDNASSFAVTFKASGQTGVSVAAAEKVTVYFNGTDYIKIAGTIANAAGSNTQVQFNNSGLLGASASLTWDGTTLSSTQVNITGQGTLRLQDTTGGEYVGLRSPSALGASYTLTFPADDGTSGQALITDGSGVLSWSTAASGDVYGPGSSTDNAVARFDSTTGKLLQNSVVLIGDTGAVTGVTDLSASGSVTLSGGTANGVTYLNGSKVLTSGSALTFDGNRLAIAGSSASTNRVDILNDNGNATFRVGYDTSNNLTITRNTGDANIYLNATQSGAAQVWQLAGTEGMRLTSTGLGIGTSSPSDKLDVFGGKIRHTLVGGGVQLVLGNSLNAVSLGSVQASGDASLAFYTNTSTERMRLNSAGNLGLGVTPSAWSSEFRVMQVGLGGAFYGRTVAGDGDKVGMSANVYKNTSFVDTYITTDSASKYDQAGGAHIWYNAASGTAGNAISFTQAMTLDASGNLGIGTSSPSARLSVTSGATGVQGLFSHSSGTPTIAIGNSTTNYNTQIGYNVTSEYGYIQATAATGVYDDIAINPLGGNVGIGTSSPSAKLHVKAGSNQNLLVSTSSSVLGLFAVNDPVTAPVSMQIQGLDLRFNTGTSTTVENLRLDAFGNLGLGVVPSSWSGAGPVVEVGTSKGNAFRGAGINDANVESNAYYNAGWKYANTGYANRYAVGNGNGGGHYWYNAASGTAGNAITFTQAMTLDSSGNLGVGTTSPSARVEISQTINGGNGVGLILNDTSSSGANEGMHIQWRSGTDKQSDQVRLGQISNATGSGSNLAFYTNGADTGTATERARIDSSGNLLVGGTSGGSGNSFTVNTNTGNGLYTQTSHPNGTGSGVAYAIFYYNASNIGSITQSGTTAVLYNTTSDQRLKENIQDADSASSLIDSLQVRKFDWKSDGTHQRYGFVAQELVTVAPEAVHQPEDTEQMMAVDYSKLVPMLVKEIQSLRQRVAQLETN